jgi:hypothetical protein
MKKKLLINLVVLLLETTLLIVMAAGELGNPEKQEILAAQNRYRAEVNVTPLAWSDNLSAQAQKCADFNAAKFLKQGTMKHCPTPGFGQNIAQATASSHLTLTQMVDQWGNEKRYFINGGFPSVSSTGSPAAVGHYTQMIWQNSSEVGCGEASAGGNNLLVCDYSPQGNINGTVVYAPPRPPTVLIQATNTYSGWSQRNILSNTVLNRPVSCYFSLV